MELQRRDPSVQGSVVIDIAPATPADRDWLLAQDSHIPADAVDRCIASSEYLIARIGGERRGFLRFTWFWRTIPYMEMIRAIDRRKGIGTALFKRWESDVRARCAELLMTSSMSDELEPQAWHRRNGFVESGSLIFGHLQPTPEVFFVKRL